MPYRLQEYFAAICFLLCCASASNANAAGALLDLSAVKEVEVSGDASALTITASAAGLYGVTFTNHRKGWFANWQSSWFFDSCASDSRAIVEGPVLKVRTVASSWYNISDCVVDAVINVPKETALTIQQDATWLRMDGDFGPISAKGNAMDVSLDGHASSLSLSGHAMHVRASYRHVEKSELVEIRSSALLADLEFAGTSAADYSVAGSASFVDSRLPNTPGAWPKVRIEGNFVRATIR